MNKKTLVLSAAIAGLVLGGAKLAQADHHEGDTTKKAEAGKGGCKTHAKKKNKKKGAENNACNGKSGCGAEAKKEGEAAAPATNH